MTQNTTIADLRAQVDAIEGRKIELEAERSELSYSAVVEKNATATKRIAAIATELAGLDNIRATLSAALAETSRRAAAADTAARDAAERDKAEKALALLDSFSKRGAAMDAKFDEAVAEFNAMLKEFRELDALGYPPTTYNLVASNMRLALKTKLMQTGLIIEHLAPNMRRNFLTALEGWVAHTRARATAALEAQA
jgi:hypothetical protein